MKITLGKTAVQIPWGLGDRVKAFFNPDAGMDIIRNRVRQVALGGYVGGDPARRSMRNWFTTETSANADISPSLPALRTRSRDLVRNVPLATGAISTVVTNVVGDGLALQSIVDRDVLKLSPEAADAWQKAAEREFAIWAKRADFTDRQNFDGLQSLVMRSVLESGDVLVVRRKREEASDTYGLKLQLVEADRLSNPPGKMNSETLVDGVELDVNGRPVGYHIASSHPGDFWLSHGRNWKYYEKGATVGGSPLILHLFDQRRPDQARGVPYLSPVVEAIKQLGDYSHAEIRAAVISAMFTVFITRPLPDDGSDPIVGDDQADNIDSDTELTLGAGAVIDLNKGEVPEFANPNRPNTAFDGFVTAMCRQIGVALELPYEVLLKSFTASYSASRAALEMAWQFFRQRRQWLAWNFCQPVYEWVITEAVAKGRLAAPGFFADPVVREAWLGSEWVGPARIQLDPQKEAAADLIDLNMGTKTRQQIIMERTGGSFEAKHAQLVKEKTARDAAGMVTAASASQVAQAPADPGTANNGGQP